jgi:hypothetical protein
MKKITGDDAQDHYEEIDRETGQINSKKPEYITMSRRPGIASDWYAKYHQDVFPNDYVISQGKKLRTPKYYDNILERENPEILMKLKEKRKQNALKQSENTTDKRLKVRQKIANIKLRKLQRKLHNET